MEVDWGPCTSFESEDDELLSRCLRVPGAASGDLLVLVSFGVTYSDEFPVTFGRAGPPEAVDTISMDSITNCTFEFDDQF